jgi:hypothetical protein
MPPGTNQNPNSAPAQTVNPSELGDRQELFKNLTDIIIRQLSHEGTTIRKSDGAETLLPDGTPSGQKKQLGKLYSIENNSNNTSLNPLNLWKKARSFRSMLDKTGERAIESQLAPISRKIARKIVESLNQKLDSSMDYGLLNAEIQEIINSSLTTKTIKFEGGGEKELKAIRENISHAVLTSLGAQQESAPTFTTRENLINGLKSLQNEVLDKTDATRQELYGSKVLRKRLFSKAVEALVDVPASASTRLLGGANPFLGAFVGVALTGLASGAVKWLNRRRVEKNIAKDVSVAELNENNFNHVMDNLYDKVFSEDHPDYKNLLEKNGIFEAGDVDNVKILHGIYFNVNKIKEMEGQSKSLSPSNYAKLLRLDNMLKKFIAINETANAALLDANFKRFATMSDVEKQPLENSFNLKKESIGSDNAEAFENIKTNVSLEGYIGRNMIKQGLSGAVGGMFRFGKAAIIAPDDGMFPGLNKNIPGSDSNVFENIKRTLSGTNHIETPSPKSVIPTQAIENASIPKPEYGTDLKVFKLPDGTELKAGDGHFEADGNGGVITREGKPFIFSDRLQVDVDSQNSRFVKDIKTGKILGEVKNDGNLSGGDYSLDKNGKLVKGALPQETTSPDPEATKPKINLPEETVNAQNLDTVKDIDGKPTTANGTNHFGKTAKGEDIVDANKKPVELPKEQVVVTTKDGTNVVINRDTGEVVKTVNEDNTLSDATTKQTYNPETKELSTPDKTTPDPTRDAESTKTSTLDKPIAKDDLGKAPNDKNLEYRQNSNGKVVKNINGEGIEFNKNQNVIENNGNQYVTEKDDSGNVTIKGKVNSDGLYQRYEDGKAPVIKDGEILNSDGSKIESTKAQDPEQTAEAKITPEKLAVGKDVNKVEVNGKPYKASSGKHFEYTDDKGSILKNENGTPKELGPNENVVELGKGNDAQIVLIDTKTNKIVGMVNAGDQLNQPTEGKVFGFKDGKVVEIEPNDKAALLNQKELPKAADTQTLKEVPSNKTVEQPSLDDLDKKTGFDSEKFVPTEDKVIGEYTVKLPEGLSTEGIKNHQYFELNEVLGKDGINKIPKGYHASFNQEGTALLRDKYGNVSLFRKGEYPVYVGNKLMSGTTDAKGMGEIINKDRINYKLVAKRLEKVLNSNSGKTSTIGLPSFAK